MHSLDDRRVMMKRFLRFLFVAFIVGAVCGASGAWAQASQAQVRGIPQVPTIRVNSKLVFLDVTVVDDQGQPVTSGLTRDDFTITEEGKRRPIFSFEPPERHTGSEGAGQTAHTILLIDVLNSNFEQIAFIRNEVKKYLDSQPERLESPTALMVLGNESLKMVQDFTQSKTELLSAWERVPVVYPYKGINAASSHASFRLERIQQSIDALQQIALQNKGVLGRKNIIWIGYGGPDFATQSSDEDEVYIHNTANLLVDGRVSLFMVYPGIQVASKMTNYDLFQGSRASIAGLTDSEISTMGWSGGEDPFETSGGNFGKFVNESGGHLFGNRNDVDVEIARAAEWGTESYTLTYRPSDGEPDGKFRAIKVSVRDPHLHVMTKAGYFAPGQQKHSTDMQRIMDNLVEISIAGIPFHALHVMVDHVVCHADTNTVQFRVLLSAQNVVWRTGDGGRKTQFLVAAASLDKRRNLVASMTRIMTAASTTTDPQLQAIGGIEIPMTGRFPPKANSLRIVVQNLDSGRIGTFDLDRQALEAAVQAPTPEPKLVRR